MENQDQASGWDDLARELGAEISEETRQREEAAAQQKASSSQKREPSVEPPAPLRKQEAADWDGLANELGLPPAPPEEKPAPPAREQRPRPAPRREETRQPEEGRRDEPRRRDSRSEGSRGE